MYLPLSERGELPKWRYFKPAKGYEAEDPFALPLWTATVNALAVECALLEQSAVCSPAVANDASDDQIGEAVQIGDALADALTGSGMTGLQSAFIRASTLASAGRPETVASILTNGKLDSVYFVPKWVAKTNELDDAKEMTGFARTLGYVAGERRTLVAFCGPDMILWNAAGAESVATGKYANQQRWDPTRWEPKKSGGSGSASYYFEESRLTWLRTEDIVRLDTLSYDVGLAADPMLPVIRKRIAALQLNPRRTVPVLKNGKPVLKRNGNPKTRREGAPEWASEGWLQWLWWFAYAERRLTNGETTARELVENAQKNWRWLYARRFLAADVGNDGKWLTAWRTTLDAIGA